MRRRTKLPKGYDSWFEYDLHRNYLSACKFHEDAVQYVQTRMYKPDFRHDDTTGFTVYIEAKGRFRDSAEARKYVDVKRCLNPFEELVFVFQDPNKPMPNSKRRADGTKYTHADWATRHGFRYFTKETLPKEWRKE